MDSQDHRACYAITINWKGDAKDATFIEREAARDKMQGHPGSINDLGLRK